MRVICADCNIEMKHMENGVYMCFNCGNAVKIEDNDEEVKEQ